MNEINHINNKTNIHKDTNQYLTEKLEYTNSIFNKSLFKKKFLSEYDFYDISKNFELEKVKNKISIQKYINNKLPYSEDLAYLPRNKFHQVINKDYIRSNVFLTIVIGTFYFVNVKYKFYFPNSNYALKKIFYYPLIVFIGCLLHYNFFYFFYFHNQPHLTNQMTPIIDKNELYYNLIQEKTDMFDSIDALLDLKEKYSLYELNQLKKEEIQRNNSIIQNSLRVLKL